MTENKRFTITGDRGISDHQKKRLYDLNDFDGMISVTETLNELHDENKELKEEIIEWKSKYFDAMDTVINEYSTNIKEDMEELKKEVWGDVE